MIIHLKQKLLEFETRKFAVKELLTNGRKYNYNSICRCGKKQTSSSMINWLKKHNNTIESDYVCKDCYKTKSFNLFGEIFNTHAQAIKYINDKHLLKCNVCNKTIISASMNYWINKLIKDPNTEIICKHCKDSRNIVKYNKSLARKEQQKTLCYQGAYGLIDAIYKRFTKTNLLSEYKKFEGDFNKRLNSKIAKKIIRKFESKGVYCNRYVDYILKYCKITKSGNHHLYPKTIFGELKYFIKCDDYTHSILHYLLALDNFEHYYKNNLNMKKAIYGLHARWQFYPKQRNKIFTKQLLKRMTLLEK